MRLAAAIRFELDYALALLKKPYVAILDGTTSESEFRRDLQLS